MLSLKLERIKAWQRPVALASMAKIPIQSWGCRALTPYMLWLPVQSGESRFICKVIQPMVIVFASDRVCFAMFAAHATALPS